MSFYVLNNQLFNDDEYAINERIEPINRGDCDYCDLCDSPISLLKWLPPYNVRVTKKRLGDFIFGDVHPFLVSQKFKDVYENGGYGGIDSFSPVQLYFRRQLLDVAYHFPIFLPNFRRLDLDRCGIRYDPAAVCPRCQHGGERDYSQMLGIFWEDEGAITEDVIKTKATSNFSFSQRLKDAMEAAGITNTVFVPAEVFVPSHVLALRPKRG
jgi:hypothetical protein